MPSSSEIPQIPVINLHYISGGGDTFSTRYEQDPQTLRVIQKRRSISTGIKGDLSTDITLKYPEIPNTVTILRIEGPTEGLRQFKLNIPSMIRCQNCETNYSTKYQYQRHQCEFNAEKVILKPDADLGDLERGRKAKFDCTTCGKQFTSRCSLERHQTCHENGQENTCEHCKKQFVSENRLRIHKENHCKKAGDISKFYRSDVTVWRCGYCKQVFSTNAIATNHAVVCTPSTSNDTESESKLVEKVSTEILLQCEFCNRTYADKDVLLSHQREHTTDRSYECVVCSENFDSYVVATQHWLKKCSDKSNLFYLPKLTYCEYCDRTFKSHEILYTHKIKKKHYTPKKYIQKNDEVQLVKPSKSEDGIDKLIEDVLIALEIPLKHKKFDKENIEPLQESVTIKEEPLDDMEIPDATINGVGVEKKRRGRKRKYPITRLPVKGKRASGTLEHGCVYQCERCIKVWESVAELEAHREQEHAANFNCDECGQVLHSARALLIHSRAHKSLKPYVCDTCGRSYSQTSHLWQHMRFHQGIKPFACPHEGCEARYTIRPDLKDHIRKVHTRERPFKCNVCGKCFLTGSVYYQHRLIHTEDRRYGCDMCEKRFFRADALNNHKRIHTNERPYPCAVCGRLFRQKGDRNKHFRTQHPDASIN